MLYSFQDGTADGWQAETNVTSVTAVTSFAEGPGHPYNGRYALDAWSADGAAITAPRTMTVTPPTPLNLSGAALFYLFADGYGYSPYATGYTVTVTLASGTHTLTDTVPVQCNSWNRVSVWIAAWAYRDHITRISVSYTGVGSSTPWYPHFQIDDVGYLT